MSSSDSSKVISGKSQTAYDRYELPNVKTRQQQKQEQAGMLTARQLEDLQKQAYDEGFQLGKEEGHVIGVQQGVDEGRQQGLQEGKQEVAHIVKRFEQIIQFLTQPVEQIDQDVEKELLALSMATAKQIIRREIHVDPGQIVAVIKEAIAALPSGLNKIKVFLHPADAEIAREHLQVSSLKDKEANGESKTDLWTIIEEPILTRGGCRIETDVSQIDATIETRLAEIAAQILGSERADTRNEETLNEEAMINPEPMQTEPDSIDKNNASVEEFNNGD